MRITVLAFAAARDALGTARLDLELAGESPAVADALAALAERHPGLRPHVAALRVAVDEEFASAGTRLHAGATLALLPPMSGG